ncbi:MAG: hypothetical protein CMK07_11095 [Ponticaulis sp.]|nr:hypothetical protein [Ponticaulis sp.]
MDKQSRRAAKEAFQKRDASAGIYLIRCTTSDEVWVGKTRNLGAIWNRMSFAAVNDPLISKSFRAAWGAHGESAFSFEVLEVMPEDLPAAFMNSTLKERMDFWKLAHSAELI